MGAVAASWVAVVVTGLGAVGGIAFAAWTSEAVALDATLMPVFEEQFGVEPPYSTIGRGAVAVDELRRQAKSQEDRGDFPGAAVTWLKVQQRDAADVTAKAALPRVLSAMGDRLR